MAKGTKVKVELLKDCDAGKAGTTVAVSKVDADKLIASGDAQLVASSGATEVALLIDCIHGKAGAVVSLSDADAAAAVSGGFADDDESAVAFRKSENAPVGGEKALEG